mmetsp:Transcript_18550/g.34651  ORF Transcript_18550/g.34651 Transcript_18550/m.34651 type:complete len:239 (+) Transcript_18550:1117-1833(+)
MSAPLTLATNVAQVLPQTALFFLKYLAVILLTSLPVQLLGVSLFELADLYKKRLLRWMVDGMRGLRKHKSMQEPVVTSTDCDYGVLLPSILFYLTIAVTFWIMSPLVLFLTTLLFQCLYLCWKYLLCYVYKPSKQETGGRYWFQLVSYSLGSLLASAVLLVLYMSARRAPYHTLSLLPLPVCIWWCWLKVDAMLLPMRSVKGVSYEHMREVDLARQQQDPDSRDFRRDFYVPEALQPM